MSDQAARGKTALDASNFDEAIVAYTAALKVSPTSPAYLIARSTAYLRAKQPADSLLDADNAVLNAQKRAKRELIVEAQFRRGCALYNLQRYGDAKYVFAVVKRLLAEHKMVDVWIQKTSMALTKLPEDDEKRKLTVKETPEAVVKAEVKVESTSKVDLDGATTTTPNPTISFPPQQTPADKIKWDWYQNNDNIYFTLSVKGAPKDKVVVDIQKRSLNISFPLATGSSYDLTLDPLFADVRPGACIPRILSVKIEVVLVKATPGIKWPSLEGTATVDSPTLKDEDESTGAGTIRRAVLAADRKPPAYPTSSRNGPKNWDKITASKEGEEDDDEVGGDPANGFFKKLFKGASPETQRAMMKSYTESNGTALSTNWEEVSKGPVETSPPDGMEARKW